jgi:hypothetical protein
VKAGALEAFGGDAGVWKDFIENKLRLLHAQDQNDYIERERQKGEEAGRLAEAIAAKKDACHRIALVAKPEWLTLTDHDFIRELLKTPEPADHAANAAADGAAARAAGPRANQSDAQARADALAARNAANEANADAAIAGRSAAQAEREAAAARDAATRAETDARLANDAATRAETAANEAEEAAERAEAHARSAAEAAARARGTRRAGAAGSRPD